MTESKKLLSNRQVRSRYADTSRMTIWRWCERGAFPKPDRTINGRNYWYEQTLDTYDSTQQPARQSA